MDAPVCPRCGYDVSGDVASWREVCPLEGRCPECGLGFRWSDLISGNAAPPPWHVEHVRPWPVRRCFGMLLRSTRSSRFWSSFSMEQLRRPSRSARYAVYGLIAALLLTVPLEIAADYGAREVGRAITGWARPAWPMTLEERMWRTSAEVASAGSPARAVVWRVSQRRPLGATKPLYRLRPRVGPDLAPLSVVLFAVVAPMTYLALPATLGSARVRWSHLLRAAAFSLPVVVLFLEVLLIATGFCWAVISARNPMTVGPLLALVFGGGLAWVVFFPIQQWLWWSAVNEHYLRLDRPRLIATVMVTIAALASLIPLMLFTPVGAWLLTPLFW